MKKRITLAMICCMLSLTGCTEKASNTNNTQKQPSQQSDVIVERPEEMTFTEMDALNNKEAKVVIKALETKENKGYTIKIELENKTKDKTLMYAFDYASLNGVLFEPYFTTVLQPGENTLKEIKFEEEVIFKELKEITDIELSLNVYDSNNWDAEPVAQEIINIYPYGRVFAGYYQREPRDTDQLLVDNHEFSVYVTGYEYDSLWGYHVNFYMVNKTQDKLMMSVENTAMNQIELDAFFTTALLPKKSSFSVANWMISDLQENMIFEVNEIAFTLRVYRENEDKDLYKEEIVLKP